MAKGTISKKKKDLRRYLAPSLRSRAARRATSPGIDTDKSLKGVRPPPESVDHRPSVLAIHHGAGVSKKQKKGRAMSTKARKRHEKAQDRAAAVMERTEKRMALSKDQSRRIQGRRKLWEEINQNIPLSNNKAEPRGTRGRASSNGDNAGESGSEFDDEMGEAREERRSQQGGADKVDITTETMADQGDEDCIL